MSYATTEKKKTLTEKGAAIVLGALFLLALWRTIASFGDHGVAFGVNLLLWGSIVICLPLALLGARIPYFVTLFATVLIGISSLGTAIMALAGSLPVPPGMTGDMTGSYYVTTVIEAALVVPLCAAAICCLRGVRKKRKR